MFNTTMPLINYYFHTLIFWLFPFFWDRWKSEWPCCNRNSSISAKVLNCRGGELVVLTIKHTPFLGCLIVGVIYSFQSGVGAHRLGSVKQKILCLFPGWQCRCQKGYPTANTPYHLSTGPLFVLFNHVQSVVNTLYYLPKQTISKK